MMCRTHLRRSSSIANDSVLNLHRSAVLTPKDSGKETKVRK